MTNVIEAGLRQNWAQRLSPAMRVGAMLLLGILLVFVVGVIVGFTTAAIEHGHAPHKPAAYIAGAVTLALGAATLWAMTRIVRAWRASSQSSFDRRYTRMVFATAALGAVLGIGFALTAGPDDSMLGKSVFSNNAIGPSLAIALAIISTILLAACAILYHRTIDDHEERAYLWGSTMAYYFIVLAFTVAWLLARGGLIEPLGIGAAMIILAISLVIQAAVWLWFKFQ